MSATSLQRSLTTLAATAALLTPLLSQAASADTITSAAASAAINNAEKTADSTNAKVCIAVVDGDGMLKAFKMMDGAGPGCVASAIKKAQAAARYHTPTLAFMERVNHGEPALLALPDMVPLGGGVPVEVHGNWVGAVGAAGTKNPDEVKIATAGADTLSQK